MKCDCLIHNHITKKGKVKPDLWISPYKRVVEGWSTKNDNRYSGIAPFEESDLERCDGEIKATVEIGYEAYFGGSDAVLEITYKCEKCGAVPFEELPQNGITLSKFLTEIIANVTQEQRDKWLDDLRIKKIEQDRKTAELLAAFNNRKKK